MIISHPVSCDWRPLNGFSVFEFGAAINRYLAGGTVLRPDCLHEVDLKNEAHSLYRSDRLKCSVRETNGVVDEISTSVACLFEGVNLVGLHVDDA